MALRVSKADKAAAPAEVANPIVPDDIDTSAEVGQEEEEEEAPIRPRTQQMAAQPQRSAQLPSTTVRPASDDDGFDGLDDDIGFGSFPILKLDKKDFICGSHTFDEVAGVLLGGKKKMLFKARKGEEDDIPMAYSYDGVTKTSGEPLSDLFEQWRNDGEMEGDPIKLVYMEAMFAVQDTGTDLDGQIVLANIAPQSVKVLAGYQAIQRLRGRKLPEVVTMICLGAKVQMKNGKTFYPWNFKALRDVA